MKPPGVIPNMIRHVVISVDYEIFGDGTGDVRQHVTGPALRMGQLCHRYGVPLTVFFQVEEYLAFEKFRETVKEALGYDAAALIKDQLVRMAAEGHDIQLHLHPEWVGAGVENGIRLGDGGQRSEAAKIQWRLNRNKCSVDDLFETQEETTRYIRERKEVIESLVGITVPGKKVVAYRAGAFSAQPGVKLIKALTDNGILIDSSVVQGLLRQSEFGGLDYRCAPCAKGPWQVSRDVSVEDKAGLVSEFPIYSMMGRRYHQLTIDRLRAKFSKNVPKARQKEMVQKLGISRNPFRLLNFLFQPVPLKADYHNVAPDKLYSWIKAAPQPLSGRPDVVVLIGHTKEHIDDRPLDRLLQLITADSSLKIVGFNDVAEMLKKKQTSGR